MKTKKSRYFIIELQENNQLIETPLHKKIDFFVEFEIKQRFFCALEFKNFQSETEVKNMITNYFKNDSDEIIQIIPNTNRIKRYSSSDFLYITNFPEELKIKTGDFIKKFCVGACTPKKCYCYYSVESSYENLERLVHFLPIIPIELPIMASYSCIEFPILRFAGLSINTSEDNLKRYITENSNCTVVDIKFSKSRNNMKFANVLLGSTDEIEEAINKFNFCIIDDTRIYVKQFLELHMGIEVQKYEISVFDLPENIEYIDFHNQMSQFGRIYECIVDHAHNIGYITFIFDKSRQKLLNSSHYHAKYSIVSILIGNFPPNTKCDDVMNYILKTINGDSQAKQVKLNEKDKNSNFGDDNDDNNNQMDDSHKNNDIEFEEEHDNNNLNTNNNDNIDLEEEESNQENNKNSNINTDNDSKGNNENDFTDDSESSQDSDEFDLKSIVNIKVFKDDTPLDQDQLRITFTLPTFVIEFKDPYSIDYVLNKLEFGCYNNLTIPYAIRNSPRPKENSEKRSGILTNLGYQNSILIQPIHPDVTLEQMFNICSQYGKIMFFQINLKRDPIFCIVKYRTKKNYQNAFESLNGSNLHGQILSVFDFPPKNKEVLNFSKSEEKSDQHQNNSENEKNSTLDKSDQHQNNSENKKNNVLDKSDQHQKSIKIEKNNQNNQIITDKSSSDKKINIIITKNKNDEPSLNIITSKNKTPHQTYDQQPPPDAPSPHFPPWGRRQMGFDPRYMQFNSQWARFPHMMHPMYQRPFYRNNGPYSFYPNPRQMTPEQVMQYRQQWEQSNGMNYWNWNPWGPYMNQEENPEGMERRRDTSYWQDNNNNNDDDDDDDNNNNNTEKDENSKNNKKGGRCFRGGRGGHFRGRCRNERHWSGNYEENGNEEGDENNRRCGGHGRRGPRWHNCEGFEQNEETGKNNRKCGKCRRWKNNETDQNYENGENNRRCGRCRRRNNNNDNGPDQDDENGENDRRCGKCNNIDNNDDENETDQNEENRENNRRNGRGRGCRHFRRGGRCGRGGRDQRATEEDAHDVIDE